MNNPKRFLPNLCTQQPQNVVVSGTSTAPRKPPRRNVSVSPVRGASGGGSAGDLLLLCKINEIEVHIELIKAEISMCPLSQR